MKTKRILLRILLLASLFISSCLSLSVTNAGGWEFTTLDKPLQAISANGSEGVILPRKLVPEVLNQCSRPAPSVKEGVWEPTAKDIKRLEGLLPAYVAAHPPQLAPDLLRTLKQYKRQYAGVIQKGRRIIYVNVFLSYPSYGSDDWRRTAVVVCDGGAAFWGIEFDVASGTFSNLFTNGVA
jgi:hypothetical protein